VYALEDNLSTAKVMATSDITNLFQLPLSRLAYDDHGIMLQVLQDNPLMDNEDV
jgi:hypothetical protein